MQKRIAILFIVILFILALVPAFHLFEDEALQKNCPFCNAYDQLFTASNAFYQFDGNVYWIKTSSSQEILHSLPKTFLSPAETRAPPA